MLSDQREFLVFKNWNLYTHSLLELQLWLFNWTIISVPVYLRNHALPACKCRAIFDLAGHAIVNIVLTKVSD